MATQRQFEMIKSLIAQHELSDALSAQVQDARTKAMAGTLSVSAASDLITALMAAPMLSLEGMHKVNDTVYKVQRAVHGNGRVYAKQLTVLSTGEFQFEYAPGAIRFLTQDTRMSVEDAAAFGHLYGRCVQCGRTLTDEDSIARGIGPVCASYFAA